MVPTEICPFSPDFYYQEQYKIQLSSRGMDIVRFKCYMRLLFCS